LTISAHRFSASALEKIQKAGGQANVLARGDHQTGA
jgi:ribosomal protein L18E